LFPFGIPKRLYRKPRSTRTIVLKNGKNIWTTTKSDLGLRQAASRLPLDHPAESSEKKGRGSALFFQQAQGRKGLRSAGHSGSPAEKQVSSGTG
jgi:hypothetical protein